jgi:tetratricopeptide (TPR) repeat protein
MLFHLQKSSLLALCLGAVLTASPGVAEPRGDDAVFEDPEWRKRFLGSYGFLSGAEPDIAQSELVMLRDVLDTMQVNPRAAATMLEQQLVDDSSAALDFILANLEFQTGQNARAAAHYESAIAKFPDFRRAHKNLGLLQVQGGDCKKALTHLTRALELGDRDGRNFGLVGYCYLDAENYVAAAQAYENAILQEPDTRDWRLGLARALLAMERYREAASLFETLIAENPDDASAWLLQANAYLGLEKRLAAAVNLETVRLLGKAQNSSLVLLGDIYMTEGMTELAKNAYVAVVESDTGGKRFETAYRAADLLVRSGAYDDAGEVVASIRKKYANGGALSNDDELRFLTLEARLARAQGRKQEAARLLEQVVERDGTRGDALLELAAHHHGQGETARALLFVERAENLEAFEYQALLDHAQYMVSSRDYTKAAELLRRAIALKREPRVERFLDRVEQALRG